jgi:hypothetical protein
MQFHMGFLNDLPTVAPRGALALHNGSDMVVTQIAGVGRFRGIAGPPAVTVAGLGERRAGRR